MMNLAEITRTLEGLDVTTLTPAPGAWSLAQVLAHCAQSVEFSLTGFPQMKPAPVRFIARFVMRGFLKDNAMKHDLMAAIPGAPALDVVDAERSRARLLASIRAFAEAQTTRPHFAY
ncbi:MAG TPA: DUF1569 domain-containing protein, partial [Myxococcota bacterium]